MARRSFGILAAALTLACAHAPSPPPIQGGEGLTPGDRVLARWKEGLFPAAVVTVQPGLVTVAWEGPPQAQSQVQRDWVARLQPISAAAPGSWAACADRKSFVLCQIVRDDDDELTVLFAEDGSDHGLRRKQVAPLPAGLVAWAAETGAKQLGTKAQVVLPEPAAEPSAAPVPGKVYGSEGEFPAGWVKSTSLQIAGVDFQGMSDAQKAAAMQALNQRNCECGCGMGSIALCAQKDPNCPRSPMLARKAVDLAKQGKDVGGILAVIDRENPARAVAKPAEPAKSRRILIPAHSPRKGPKGAKVTIVEFSDFQCPFCGRVIATLKQIEEKYGKDVAVVFVNQPLPFHSNARPAAKAFMAAHKQGKAWPMHDKLFANQQALGTEDLEKYAHEIKLDVAKWKKDLEDPATETLIADDQSFANSVGANGTPTFFINGRELSGAQPFPTFAAMIDEEIKKADALLKRGTKPEQLYGKLMEQAATTPEAAAPATTPEDPAEEPAERVTIVLGDAPVKGPRTASITIVMFSDFQCPFCARVISTLKQIEETYKGKVRFAFKNLPLPFHNNAALAAEAALAAQEQGKFWEYHDMLFTHQQELDRASLEKHAQALGLDLPKFKAALDSHKYKKRLEQESKEASAAGATGTPTFFINGKKLVGAQPFETFKAAIEAELSPAKAN
jgi:protein-disulfide isomerase